jgi:hypothetical protein
MLPPSSEPTNNPTTHSYYFFWLGLFFDGGGMFLGNVGWAFLNHLRCSEKLWLLSYHMNAAGKWERRQVGNLGFKFVQKI